MGRKRKSHHTFVRALRWTYVKIGDEEGRGLVVSIPQYFDSTGYCCHFHRSSTVHLRDSGTYILLPSLFQPPASWPRREPSFDPAGPSAAGDGRGEQSPHVRLPLAGHQAHMHSQMVMASDAPQRMQDLSALAGLKGIVCGISIIA